MKKWIFTLLVELMATLRHLPLPWVRSLGWVLGLALHCTARERRGVARTNLRLCFPQADEKAIRQMARLHFIAFAQAWLDRGWIWHAPSNAVANRIRLAGRVDVLSGDEPVVLFAPHFVGLDAAWAGLTLHLPRTCCGLYAPQANEVVDNWMAQGRRRFGEPQVIAKWQGLKPIAVALRAGKPLYLLPDMDHGMNDSVWAPFFGHSVATLTSLPRFAALGRAKVVPILAKLTREGYEVEVLPPWDGYPSGNLDADVAKMNRELEKMIAVQPEQYYWVHKRFKTRPGGEPSVYG